MVTTSEFIEQCESFIAASEKCGDHWQFIEVKSIDSGGYLEKQDVRIQPESSKLEAPTEPSVDCFKWGKQDAEEGYAPSHPNRKLRKFVYQIIFNEAFETPQLFFNAYESDGSLVPLEFFHDSVPEHLSAGQPPSEIWNSLSQVEHPILHVPYYTLHPCKTDELIRKLRAESPKNWLISWLSSVGPAIGLHLSNYYGSLQ